MKRDCSQPYVREENVTEQVDALVRSLAVPTEWTEWMLAELAAEHATDATEYERKVEAFAERRRQIDLKLDRLLSAHLDGDLTQGEYRAAKARLIADKQNAAEQAATLSANCGNRFEPVTRFVKSLSEATLLASGTDAVAKLDFVRRNGSNLRLETRRLRWEPRGAWKIVENHGPFAHQHIAASCDAATVAGETCPTFSIAERAGFEPARRYKRLRDFQSRSFGHSDTSPKSTGHLSSFGVCGGRGTLAEVGPALKGSAAEPSGPWAARTAVLRPSRVQARAEARDSIGRYARVNSMRR